MTLESRIVALAEAIGIDIKAINTAIDGLGGGPSGGSSLSVVTVNIPTAKLKLAEVVVSVPAALETSTVVPWLVPNSDWDADDLAGYSVIATAGTATITFTIVSEGPIVGDFKIAYILE